MSDSESLVSVSSEKSSLSQYLLHVCSQSVIVEEVNTQPEDTQLIMNEEEVKDDYNDHSSNR